MFAGREKLFGGFWQDEGLFAGEGFIEVEDGEADGGPCGMFFGGNCRAARGVAHFEELCGGLWIVEEEQALFAETLQELCGFCVTGCAAVDALEGV